VALARLDPEPAPALGETGEKKPTDNGWFLGKWWSWRELNPRPQAFFIRFYMLSLLI